MVIDLRNEVKTMPFTNKRDFLLSKPERELHEILKHLFDKAEDKSLAEITCGRDEFGRDLVIKRQDPYGESYVGVIVKKGDESGKITGETDGVVDNIISQGNQAITHPCLLREISVGSVSINSIFVIFVGRLTDHASQRIERELKIASARLVPIAILIDLLTDNCPDIFFEGDVVRYIQDRIMALETKREFPARSKPLSVSFVDPYVTKMETPLALIDAVMECHYGDKLLFKKLEEIAGSGKKIIIVGEPGTGKSTALAKIALDMYTKYLREKIKEIAKKDIEVPILIKAIDISSNNLNTLIEGQLPSLPLKERIKIKVLLIDGLDEEDVKRRGEIIAKAEEFCEQNKCGLVISTRKVEAIKKIISPYERYELLPFEHEQAMKFINRILDDQDLIKILEESLQQDDLKMSLTPMSLHLLIEIATKEREIPASTAEIYEQYMDQVAGRHERAKGIESVFAYYIKKRFLSELAWEKFHSKNKIQITKADFDKFVQNYSKRRRYNESEVEKFLEEIDRAGILVIGKKVFFRHRSFLDYFTALRIMNHQKKNISTTDEIVKAYFDDIWHDVAFFFVGMMREINEEIMEKIDAFPENSFGAVFPKATIGRLIQAGWYSEPEIKLKGVSIGLRNLEPISNGFDVLIKSGGKKYPAILSDFFVLFLSEYSFGSRTMMKETLEICEQLCIEKENNSVKNCIRLLWANRSIFNEEDIQSITSQLLERITELRKKGQVTIRDEFVSLFVLEKIQKGDNKLSKRITKKMSKFRETYKNELKQLLPEPKRGGFRKKH